MKTELTLKLKKSTKGTHVYFSDVPGVAITQVYVQKEALPNPAPAAIVITIQPVE